jgi:hypothetical protein
MRDILNKLETIVEANLGSPEIPATKVSAVKDPATGKLLSRPALFLQKVSSGSPFTLVAGGEVIIDPDETSKVEAWLNTGPKGTIALKTTEGGTVKNTDLLKTVEFGSKESETIKLKGSDIFDTTDQEVQDFGNSVEAVLAAGGFPASEMYSNIAGSPQMQKLGKIGDAVILMSREATEGRVPTFPPGLKPAEIKAIELYASEYIGVLGLLSGVTTFKRGTRKEFDQFVGTNLNDMIMYFPKASNNPLADSFSVVNDETGHAIKISSKAAGKGAPPALGSLKIPAEVQEKYPEAYGFYQVATDPGLSAFTQPFAMMNWLIENGVTNPYGNLAPFSDELVNSLLISAKKGTPIEPEIMQLFNSRLSPKVQASPAPDGAKAWYAVIKDVINNVNSGAVKGFQPAIIQSLGFNFIQLYTNAKGNKLVSEAFWPATIHGEVKLKTKGSSADPTKGKISIEISPGKAEKLKEEPDELVPAAPEVVPERPKNNIKKYGRPFQR